MPYGLPLYDKSCPGHGWQWRLTPCSLFLRCRNNCCNVRFLLPDAKARYRFTDWTSKESGPGGPGFEFTPEGCYR